MDWAQTEGHWVWVFRVTDKFGDSGITALGSIEVNGASAQVRDFVLSCRVMGRKVEETVLAVLVDGARKHGAKILTAEYLATPKNRPCLEFWMRSGFEHDEITQTFSWLLSKSYLMPKQLALEYQVAGTNRPVRETKTA